MRIAIFTDAFLPQVNGIVTATIALAKGLADRGHKIYIVAPKYKTFKEFQYHNIKVKRVSSIPAGFYPDFRVTSPFSPAILKFVKDNKVDLIHFQTPHTLGLQGVFISKILRLPLVGTYHTFIANSEYLKHMHLNWKVMEHVAWTYSKLFYNRCNLVTCPSKSSKEELVRKGFKGKIHVISNGIDFSSFGNKNYLQVRKKYNPKGNLLLFVGRISFEKNLFYLLECFSDIVKKIPNIKLLIVGDGPQMSDLKKEISKLKISNNVILTGNIDHTTLVKSSIFKACDLFVTASKTETQGITLLEAMANGLPCVALSAFGVNDLITDGYNGYLAKDGNQKEFCDKVIKILNNKNIFRRMKINAVKEAHKHSLERVIETWISEYQRLIR